MAELTVTLDELIIASIVTIEAGRFGPGPVLEAIDTLRSARESVAALAQTQGMDLDSVLLPSEAFALIGQTGLFGAAEGVAE